jgi:predicted acetyltransferase
MPELIAPSVRLHRSFLAARQEWGADAHQDGVGLRPVDDVETLDGFSAWVSRLNHQADATMPVDVGHVRSTRWWITEGETYLGAIELRHHLTPVMLEAIGHIGYSVRPSARGRGLATWAVATILPEARTLGLDRVLLTCDDDNIASARTIEKNAGVLEDVRATTLGLKRRYWIQTAS